MKYIPAIIFLLFSVLANSQTYQSDKINQKAIALYEKAIVQLRDGALKQAIPILQKTIATDSNYVDAYLSLGGVYGELKDYATAIKYYETAKLKDSIYFRPYHLPYSINLAGLGNFDAALQAITAFQAIPNLEARSIKSAKYRRDCYEFALAYSQKHPDKSYVFNPINLGDSINTPALEYFPSLTVDDTLLVFTRRGEQGKGEFFYESNLERKGFTKAKLIEGDINDEPYKGAINVSADGEWMIFAGELSGKTHGSYDLYISYYTPQGWSDPENLGTNINTGYWESAPSLSPDKRALYFASNRPNGEGGSDLYVSYRDAKGNWSKAINMGKDINTIGDETAPYIHADNQTMYFTSSGLPGYGGSDLYVIHKGPMGSWSIPENLGYPINTIENEGSLAVASNGINAYYASDRSDSRGGLDLYRFDLREDIRPRKTLYVKGFVYDKKTNKGLPSNVELIDNATGKILMNVQTDETGFYFTTLPTGHDFTFNVNRKGYLFYNRVYALSNKQADSTYRENIYLQPLEMNAAVTFANIQFESKSYQLKEVSKIELDKLHQLLAENPSIKISINGHTDNVGKQEDNIKLSANRAKSVVDYLISKGIGAQRLQFKGFGDAKPIADNSTEQGKALNRRTEFVVISL